MKYVLLMTGTTADFDWYAKWSKEDNDCICLLRTQRDEGFTPEESDVYSS